VEEVLHLGATDAEVAETLDIGALMGGTLAMKSVRHAFSVIEAVRKGSV
jgi:alkylhydroperoxidase/carboxymuconolactone decarboxylase family protein YurZ